jgi:thioredoxin 1
MSTELKAVTEDDFAVEVLESDRPVVVDFWAAWCPPCRVMEPILRDLVQQRPDLRIVKIDADANHATVVQYGVLSMPTLIVFRDGEPRLRLVGSRPRRRLLAELDAVVPSPAGSASG